MGKIEEKNGGAGLQSAEEARDREFEQWVQQQFLKEAAAIEKEIDEIPDSENWKPTEESFQKLLQKAKEQGSVQRKFPEAFAEGKGAGLCSVCTGFCTNYSKRR